MASNYPGSLDSFDTIASDKKTSDSVGGRTHRQMHNDLGDAIEAVQTELGTTPSGSYATVKARFEAIEGSTLPQVDAKGDLIVGTADNTYDNLGVGTNDTVLLAASGETKGVKWAQVPTAAIQDDAVTGPKIAANAVGSSELADNAVDTAAIQDSAVTSAKIADGTITASDVAASTFAAFGTVGNLLTENQASVETDTTGLHSGFNATISRDTSVYYTGSASLKAVATTTQAGGIAFGDSVGTPVVAGEVYTASSMVRTAQAGSVVLKIQWYNSGNTYISERASAGVSCNGVWALATVTAVAPATAAYARVYTASSTTATAGDQFWADARGLWRGAGGKWQLPGVPIPGQSEIAVNDAVNLSGTGSPEGVVTAAPGSTWLQTDATTDVKGWIRWVKATGTGNTGWVAGPEADTGWRDVSASLLNGWTVAAASSFLIRRVGSVVTLRAHVQGGTVGANVYVAPAGFRPALNEYWLCSHYTTGAAIGGATWTSGGTLSRNTANGAAYPTVTVVTADAWPARLPGPAV